MLLCQLLQSRLELRRAGGAGMADRATTERRKAGTEDHPGIEQIGIGDHAFVQTSHRFVDERQEQAVFEVGGREEERSGGKEGVSTCRSRWAPIHKKKKKRR